MSTEHIQTAQGAPPAGPQLSTRQVTGIIAALALAAFMMILNETVLTVALPGIMNDLQISAATGQWLTTGFLLTLSVVIPTTGFLLQRFNHRSLFMFAIISFIIGTAVAALAPSFVLLLAARMVQALGTAIVLPLLMTTTLRLVPAQHRGTVMGLNSVVIGVGPAVGPTVSGAVVHAWGWHYIFAMMLPIAVLVLVLGAFFFKVPASAQKTRVDAASVLLSAVAFGLLVYGISSIEHASQNPAMAIASFAIGALSLVLFIRRQRGLASEGRELLNLAPFASRNFRLAVILIMIAFGTLLGSLMVVPILLESGRGLDSLTIGLMLLPGGLAQAVASPVFGRVYDRFGPRPVLIPGTAMLALGQWLYVGARGLLHRIRAAHDRVDVLGHGFGGSAPVRPWLRDLQYRPAAGRRDRHYAVRHRTDPAVHRAGGFRNQRRPGPVRRRAHGLPHRRGAGQRNGGSLAVHRTRHRAHGQVAASLRGRASGSFPASAKVGSLVKRSSLGLGHLPNPGGRRAA